MARARIYGSMDRRTEHGELRTENGERRKRFSFPAWLSSRIESATGRPLTSFSARYSKSHGYGRVFYLVARAKRLAATARTLFFFLRANFTQNVRAYAKCLFQFVVPYDERRWLDDGRKRNRNRRLVRASVHDCQFHGIDQLASAALELSR